jgi:hypothetical protein
LKERTKNGQDCGNQTDENNVCPIVEIKLMKIMYAP